MTPNNYNTRIVGDNRAVSPVIGVILMVAITVILAAVIGTFVLDLGQSAGNSAPQASLSVSADAANSEIDIEHIGGDGLDAAQTRIIVDVAGEESSWNAAASSSVLAVGGTATISIGTTDTMSSGWSGFGDADTDGTTSTIDDGEQVTVRLIDTESQRVIFETTVTA